MIPYLPNPTQHLLVKASVLSGDAALQAWREWKSAVDLNDVEHSSFRMLSALYQNLRQNHAPDDPDIRRLKGVYRISWVQNQLLFRRLQEILTQFRKHGIESVLLKGAAVVFGYYHDYGIRPMHDLDLLVRAGEMSKVKQVMESCGWRQQHVYAEPLRAYRREMVFQNDAGQEVDIHWHLLPEWCLPEQDAEFWANTSTISVEAHRVAVLNPTYSLLHLCGHGYQWNPLPSFRWILDARRIIATAGDRINWAELVAAAQRYHLTIPLRHLLTYLATELETPVPSSVRIHLDKIKPSRRERWAHPARAENPNTVYRVVSKHWFYYQSVRQRDRKPAHVFGFIHYFCLHFQDVWGLKQWWHMPAHAVRLLVTPVRQAR